jgi:hypothetical protein
MNATRPANVALVPGSLLAFKEDYQRFANQLPDDAVLICLPLNQKPQRRVLETVAGLLQANGRRVRTIPAAHISSPGTLPNSQLPLF